MKGTVLRGGDRGVAARDIGVYGVRGSNALKLDEVPHVDAMQLDILEEEHFEEVRERKTPNVARVPRQRSVQRSTRLRASPPLPVAVPHAPFIGLVLVLVISGVLGILMINTKINENSFRLDDLQDKQAAL